MLDFLIHNVEQKVDKRSGEVVAYISPEFKVRASKDLMIRGRDFYAVWNESTGFWSTSEDTALSLIDEEIRIFSEEYKKKHPDYKVIPRYTYNSSTGVIDRWHKYVQKQMRDNYHQLDSTIIFSDTETKKTDYCSKKLAYPLQEGDISAYDEMMNVLYSPEERKKIEWAIGSIITGDSKKIQKFIVLYGSAGTGKSTILNIIQDIFEGYCTTFDAKALGSANNSFALEAFRSNPLVAIQHDGDLSRIEDNTRLNSLVSHEPMQVNEKFKATYEAAFNCFLFMGTNKPVKITDAKSGIIRRLIDVSPTGKKIPYKKYISLNSQVKYELGAIAYHCKEVYLSDTGAYDTYIPMTMIGATNDMFNFMEENYYDFKEMDGVTLTVAYKRYKEYCDDARVLYPYSKRLFKEELKNYFENFEERRRSQDGASGWNVYSGFRTDKFKIEKEEPKKEEPKTDIWLDFKEQPSLFDKEASGYLAQYAKEDGTPLSAWSTVKTKLKDIHTNELHYVKVPENHIVIDFDIKNKKGEKDFKLNSEAASRWPKTYAELSKSGQGIHLHYIYTGGDPKLLSRIFDDNIEVKVFVGNSSLRRKLTLCNDIPIANINSGLPVKGEAKVVNWEGIKSEKQLRVMIKKNLNKEYHDATKPSVDYIYYLLDEAYKSGMKYDVTDLRPAVLAFASKSTNQASYCIKKFNQMQFKSEEANQPGADIYADDRIVFYDVETFPNLFLINWKYANSPNCVRMINPKPEEVEELLKYKLVGFNVRRYDNHMLYARTMGYSNEQLFTLSQRIVSGNSKNCFFSEAYNLSYTDVYDFASKKQSLKKWEIELGIHHQELGLPWDQPVPEELWPKVAEYCDNDVIATEAVFNACAEDFEARKILVDLANIFCKSIRSVVNDTTNTLTARIIFGDDKNPQSQFVYTDFTHGIQHGPFGERYSPENHFPNYEYKQGKNMFYGKDLGKGGYVYSEPGMYGKSKTFDVSSMHPNSIIRLNLFGDIYTAKFADLVKLRISIKHKDFEAAGKMFDGVLKGYLDDPSKAKSLAGALKIAINSVYGLTSASFDNKFKDNRNVNNIVALRGALFMETLRKKVVELGYKVIHIKTDSIKIDNPDDVIQNFVMKFGQQYGYSFEIEHSFDKICLVNDAVYIAKLAKDDPEDPGKWTATGTQFQVPYVFKTIFSHEPVEFDDLCETKQVTSALYLDMNEGLLEDEHNYVFIGKVGRFCPIKPGKGGGILLREKDGKYNAATGTKGYRWLEAETVKNSGKENDIDKQYYIDLADAAVKDISQYGDFEWFVSDDSELKSDPLPESFNI